LPVPGDGSPQNALVHGTGPVSVRGGGPLVAERLAVAHLLGAGERAVPPSVAHCVQVATVVPRPAVTVIVNAGSEAVLLPSVTLIVMFG
jgi:hypothetical protein